MNFYVKNKINTKAKVTFYNCTLPVISKTTFDEYRFYQLCNLSLNYL